MNESSLISQAERRSQLLTAEYWFLYRYALNHGRFV